MSGVTGITLALALSCAPGVSPETLARIVQVESGGNALAINVNRLAPQAQPKADNALEAARVAQKYIALGYSVDLGLMQVNSANLKRLGASVADMFDPCRNLAAGAAILTQNYVIAKSTRIDPQKALQAALSAYNTGNFSSGFKNGYVARYLRGPVRIDLPEGGMMEDAPEALATPSLVREPPGPDPMGEYHALGNPDPHQSSTEVIAQWRKIE